LVWNLDFQRKVWGSVDARLRDCHRREEEKRQSGGGANLLKDSAMERVEQKATYRGAHEEEKRSQEGMNATKDRERKRRNPSLRRNRTGAIGR